MSVLSDWSCDAHGIFESKTGHCPSGCMDSFVHKVFLKAPGLKSDRTTSIDGTLRSLAADFGLTDMNNQNGTSAVIRPDARKMALREEQHNQLMGKLGDTSRSWGTIPSGATGISQAMGANRVVSDNALSMLKPTLLPPKPIVVGKHDAKIEV